MIISLIVMTVLAALALVIIVLIFRCEHYKTESKKTGNWLQSELNSNAQLEKKYEAWSRYAVFLNSCLPSIDSQWDTIRQYEQERERGITHTQAYNREMAILKATIEQKILDSLDLTGDFGERLKYQKQRLRDALGYNVFRD